MVHLVNDTHAAVFRGKVFSFCTYIELSQKVKWADGWIEVWEDG